MKRNNRMSATLKNATLFLLASVVIACGGGGGDGKPASSQVTVNDGGEGGGGGNGFGVNGELKGSIYYDEFGGKHLKLDLASGVESMNPIGDEYWASFYKDVNSYDVDEINSRFFLTRDYFSNENMIQVYSLDKDYNLVDNFVFQGYGGKALHVSPDGKYISMIWISYWDRSRYFSVFDTTGKVIYEVKCRDCSDDQWKKDGSGIILSISTSLVFVDFSKASDGSELQSFIIKDFSNKENLAPNSLSISQDGKKLAFSARTGSNSEDKHIFVMNVDGTGLRQLTGGSFEGEWDVRWANEGSGLFVIVGENTYVPVECHRELYWVSESADKVVLNGDANPAVAKVVKKVDSNNLLNNVCYVENFKQPWEL